MAMTLSEYIKLKRKKNGLSQVELAERAGVGLRFVRNLEEGKQTLSGISAAIAEKMIERMKSNLPEWKELITRSFLPEKMKMDYCALLDKRESALSTIK